MEISKLYNISQSELNKTFSLRKPQPTPSNGVVDPEDKLEDLRLTGKRRGAFSRKQLEKVQAGSSALTLSEINRLKSSTLFLLNSQCD